MASGKNFVVSAVTVAMLIFVIFMLGLNDSKDSGEMMLQSEKDIIETAVAAGNFTTLAAALEAADLIETLKGPGPFTVFAPTDDAFEKLDKATLNELLKPESKEKLANILKHHVVNEKIILKGRQLKTLNDDKLFANDLGEITVNDAIIVARNIPASNGVIHVIDTVLIPSEDENKRTAMKIISTAINLGVPLYNSHNQPACAAVYESALKDRMEMPDDVVSPQSKRKISEVFQETSKKDDPGKKAWDYREVLDKISSELKHSMEMMKL